MHRSSCVDLRPKYSLEGANPRTRSSCLLDLAPFHARDRFLRTSHPASPAPCGVARSFASEVRALSSTHPRGAEILPTDFCHPIFFFSLPLCTRALVARKGRSARTEPFRETRRFTPTNLLGRDRSIKGKVFACRCRFRSTPPDASIRGSSSRPSASQPNVRGLEPLRSLLRTRRDANVRFVDQETPSTGVDSSACFLAEGAGSSPFRNRRPTRLESRLRRRYASSVTEGLVSPLRACAQGYCARGVPTKLAPACVCSCRRLAANVFRETLLWGPRDPNIQLLPYVVTHGHTRRSSQSSSARGCRLCPRCLPSSRLAPLRRPILERHDRPSEEPCLLQ